MSWNWDGCGGRTDLHEIFATFWAVVLRGNGVASANLVDEEGWGGPDETYSRALIVRQPFNALLRKSEAAQFKRLQAHTAWASHLLANALSLREFQETAPEWQEESLPWLEAVRSHLGGKPRFELFVERVNPDWRYYKANNKITLLELPPGHALLLRRAFCFYMPQSVQQGTRLSGRPSSNGAHSRFNCHLTTAQQYT
jgi:hypothetical protein